MSCSSFCSANDLFNTEGYLLRLPLPECWVVSKLHMLIDAVTESYNKYFFGDVGREIYDFFWGDFADWYIEASKARIYHSGDDSVGLVAQTVLLYVFENILKLLHPFMPFVTEELWQEEKEVLALLSKLDLDNIHFTDSLAEDAKQSVHLIASEGLEAYLPLADMVDISAEVQRLTKRLSKMQTEYEGLKARLNSPKFIEKAPKDVVRGVQEKAAEAE
ncbi:valine--tRNA ligase, chloroplastic/mitochondrial 2-like isoform X2 [Gossypium raimondii]|uniref:valine--tRNA ligase, chloroplastic/mitochondrial 2-like isoform X2 n=1 Tax=Gossypium raimondii TaxID=29730 RepID=UPI00227D2947|nr:valine--tRNA ligase, chloroplastic/mitochondrial 2-like isoform X2 [Gossypium raimondii]